MKKILIVLLAYVMIFSFVACGGGDVENNGDNPTEDTTATDTKAKSEDDKTVEGRLARAGLTLDAVKPDTRFAKADLMSTSDSTTGVKIILEGTESLDQAAKGVENEAYYTKLFQALKDASDDGKVYEPYYGLGDATEITDPFAESNFEAFILIFQWSYKVDGEWVTITSGVVPSEEDGYVDAFSLDFLY